MNSRFDYTIIDAINNAFRAVKASPLILGGVEGSGGGTGGPSGGFVGHLPQKRVTYDLSEEATSSTPASGRSLLDNLNHIRYRLQNLESGSVNSFLDLSDTPETYSGSAGKSVIVNQTEDGLIFSTISGGTGNPISVYDDSVFVASGVTILDFGNNLSVSDLGSGHILISGSSAEVTSSSSYIIHEDFTDILDGLTTHFDTYHVIESGSLSLFLNGIREKPITHYTEDGDGGGFTTLFTAASGEVLLADYLTPASGLPVPSAGTTIVYVSTTVDSEWVEINESWSYSSSTVVSVPTGATARFQKNDKIRFKQGGDYKYFYVSSLTSTQLTLTGGSDYSVGNSAITDMYYSRMEFPFGFPRMFNWTATFSDLTVGNGSYTARFAMKGNMVTGFMAFTWGTTTSITGSTPRFSAPMGYSLWTVGGSDANFGTAKFWDASTDDRFEGRVTGNNAGGLVLFLDKVDATYLTSVKLTSTIPFTWAWPDEFTVLFMYPLIHT